MEQSQQHIIYRAFQTQNKDQTVDIASYFSHLKNKFLLFPVTQTNKFYIVLVLIALTYIFSKRTKIQELFTMLLNPVTSQLNNNFGNKYSYRSDPKFRRMFKLAMKSGGFPGGLENEGNTCFMNSVIQCLSSSEEFIEFLSSYAAPNEELNEDAVDEGKPRRRLQFLRSFKSSSSLSSTSSNSDNLKNVAFSNALLNLINSLNSKNGNNSPTFRTKDLLKVMKDSPNKHLFLGYNQEDAQEFYQNVMKQVEKEFTALESSYADESSKNDEKSHTDDKCKYVELKDGDVTGLNNLGHLGNVYVPVSQIDPADDENKDKYLPYKLVTPVDGLQCDRIGCVNCGEMGGIRYSVTSGLGLNLPINGANRNRFTLAELIDEFSSPDIIDGVECNRCSLTEMSKQLVEKLASLRENETGLKGSASLISLIESRINEIEKALAQKCIPDDVYKKLHTKNMVIKSRKVKQSYLSRPPSLLCVHINRSVFDPNTYMVRKNNAKIDFPMNLDMSNFVASTDDINLDARLQFRKQDEEEKPIDRGDLLNYKLKSVISHYGTHNYGHYIAFKKLRGQWWYISDETVRLSNEDEVLNCQGTFMLFYELNESYVPTFTEDDLSDEDDQTRDEEDEEEENARGSESSVSDSSDLSDAESEQTLNEEGGVFAVGDNEYGGNKKKKKKKEKKKKKKIMMMMMKQQYRRLQLMNHKITW